MCNQRKIISHNVDMNNKGILHLDTLFVIHPGRSVMLEQPRKTANKVISHMLTSHGGEIYIHILMTSRSILEDPPSISEGSGGRITDYRINVRHAKLHNCVF